MHICEYPVNEERSNNSRIKKLNKDGTSLVVQLRLCLPIQRLSI